MAGHAIRSGPQDGPARDPIRPQRRSAHRLPGGRRRPDRPRVRAELDLAGRALLGRAAGRALLPAARVVLAADHVRPPRLGAVGPGRRRADARGADGRRRRGDGRRRLRARGRVRAARGRGDGGAVRRHPPRAHDRARAVRGAAADVVGARLRLAAGGPRSARLTLPAAASRTGGTGSRLLDCRRRRDPRLPHWFGKLERLAASPGMADEVHADERRDRRPCGAAVDPGADARDAPRRRTSSSTSATRATSPSTSRMRGSSSCRATRRSGSGSTPRSSSTRSRSS